MEEKQQARAAEVEEVEGKVGRKLAQGRTRVLLKGSEVPWQLHKDRGTNMRYLISDSAGFSALGLSQFVSDIPPGFHTSAHRHPHEAIIYILKGRGYSIVEGQRFNWSAGDSICMPIYAWHQHFNADPKEPVIYVGTTDQPYKHFLGLHYKEEKEDAEPNPPEGG